MGGEQLHVEIQGLRNVQQLLAGGAIPWLAEHALPSHSWGWQQHGGASRGHVAYIPRSSPCCWTHV
jgi:hypothetical protein